MAYPFAKHPTFEEFIARVRAEFECTFETVDAPMEHHDSDGNGPETISIHFLRRMVNGKDRTYAIFIHDFKERMEFSQIRSICDRLDLPKKEFGLTLE